MATYRTGDGIEVIEAEGVSHSHREDLNSEANAKLAAGDRPFIREVVSMGRVIGKDHLVERREEDALYYHARNGSDYKSVFVLNREAEDTDKATIVIAKGGPEDGELEGKMVLVTLFEGDPGMPEPYGRNDNEECRNFWEAHALVPTEKERAEIAEEMERNAEDQHVFDTENVRVFLLDGKHPEDSFFSPYTGEEMAAIVSLDAGTKGIRISVSDKMDGMDAKEIAEKLWGHGARGDGRAAVSPEGKEMGTKDLVRAVMHTEKAVMAAKSHGLGLGMAERRDLAEMKEMLQHAVESTVSERGLDVRVPDAEKGLSEHR